MAARKLQQEIDKCFKKVDEGVLAFEGIYDKVQQCTNLSQKEKLEENLKKEIKKLQRLRDQIKSWAAQNDIKDKKPLMEKRKLIETQMEKFKLVEKEMKTKAFSKEGLAQSDKLDPKEREKREVDDFLSDMISSLEQQIEAFEAEQDNLQVNTKKGKSKDANRAERQGELDRLIERHKWHNSKLELLMRAVANGSVEPEAVKDREEDIRYYVESNSDPNFMEDDTIYDDLDLQGEEDGFGMNNDIDRVSSQDAHSVQDDGNETEKAGTLSKVKTASGAESSVGTARRPSTQLKSPLPLLAQLHQTVPAASSGPPAVNMKPAPLPARTPGEPLKYASAAAAAAASDKNGVGIAPLPPPPGSMAAHHSSTGFASTASSKPVQVPSGSTIGPQSLASVKQPAVRPGDNQVPSKSPHLSNAGAVLPSATASLPSNAIPENAENASQLSRRASNLQDAPERERKPQEMETSPDVDREPPTPSLTNGETQDAASEAEEESIYHLPASLQDLVESLEATKSSAMKEIDQQLLALSHASAPDATDAERPRQYQPRFPNPYAPSHYPQEPLPVFDDPRLYQQVDPDTLFYSFYYRQGTYQQYLAAKALKNQSWRFHKQYQTWFQRHEEPKQITEEYEQGTYRFFDYESTWMNRRKADFKFHYKYLEDDVL